MSAHFRWRVVGQSEIVPRRAPASKSDSTGACPLAAFDESRGSFAARFDETANKTGLYAPNDFQVLPSGSNAEISRRRLTRRKAMIFVIFHEKKRETRKKRFNSGWPIVGQTSRT